MYVLPILYVILALIYFKDFNNRSGYIILTCDKKNILLLNIDKIGMHIFYSCLFPTNRRQSLIDFQ